MATDMNVRTYKRQADAAARSCGWHPTPRTRYYFSGWLAVGERTIDDHGRQTQWYYGPGGRRYSHAQLGSIPEFRPRYAS